MEQRFQQGVITKLELSVRLVRGRKEVKQHNRALRELEKHRSKT